MNLPKIELLWSEEKTRDLFNLHIKLFIIGGIATNIFAFTVPLDQPLKTYAIIIPLLFNITAPFYFLTLNKKNIGFWFLLFALETQLLASGFMAVTGGFQSVAQFGSFEILILSLFELGVQATLILSFFAVATFLGIFIFLYNNNPDPIYISQFLFYTIAYVLVVIVMRNIGRSISLQFELRDKLSELNILKNQFITLTSHHLRTPITIIKGYIEILQRDLIAQKHKNEIIEDRFEKINKAMKDLQFLMDKLLLISTFVKDTKELKEEEVDVKKIIKQIINEHKQKAKDKNIKITINFSEKIKKQKFDKKMLSVAISEIIDNAIKFSKENSTVTIELQKKGPSIFINVIDNGVGLSKKDLEQLFHANVGKKNQFVFDHKGIGLGLFLANLAVNVYDGEIRVLSKLGKGSKFTIMIPESN